MTTTTTTHTFTPEQLNAANKLAAAHHHFWANAIHVTYNGKAAIQNWYCPELAGQEAEDLSQGSVEALINKAAIAADEQWYGEMPKVDDGNIVHTTASGRLRWIVRPDGLVLLTVARPDGDVLHAKVQMPEKDIGVGKIEALVHFSYVGGQFYVRHVYALYEALKPLVGEFTAVAAVGELMTQAADYAEVW